MQAASDQGTAPGIIFSCRYRPNGLAECFAKNAPCATKAPRRQIPPGPCDVASTSGSGVLVHAKAQRAQSLLKSEWLSLPEWEEPAVFMASPGQLRSSIIPSIDARLLPVPDQDDFSRDPSFLEQLLCLPRFRKGKPVCNDRLDLFLLKQVEQLR